MRTVVAFDFDGTLTRGDSFWRFLFYCGGIGKVLIAGFSNFFQNLLAIVFPHKYADSAKEKLVKRILGSRSYSEVDALAKSFASTLIKKRSLHATIERLRWHQLNGHEIIVVSASPAIYIEPACKLLGIDTVLATNLEIGKDGYLTGRFEGKNCRGPEKANRVKEYLNGETVFLWAYGNSANDNELLYLANIGIRVDRQNVSVPPKTSSVLV